MNSHVQQQWRRRRQKIMFNRSLMLGIIVIQLFILTWACLIHSTFHSETAEKSNMRHVSDYSEHSHDVSRGIPGIELKIPSGTPNEDDIQVVYTTPGHNPNGIVLILHACTHNALKFFSQSETCHNCVGLSEELRIVRLVLERGYMPVAVSCVNSKSGCWSGSDHLRIVKVLQHKIFLNYERKYVIGASSGGTFAAELLVRDVVKGALVEVMGLNNDIVGKLKRNPKPLFLAPMPRDKHTLSVVMRNYEDLKDLNAGGKEMIVLDTMSCDSFPVTRSYLQDRVIGMTVTIADTLISKLLQEKHLDSSQMLIVDPTKSNWRDIVSPTNSSYWLDQFSLKPGYSPLAKALHRAWAYHEYCSEVVFAALNLFENNSR